MSLIKVPSFGPQPAKILIVGEAPGETETNQLRPFVGRSGMELTNMLQEAGINREECRLTNVCRIRPPSNKIENFFYNKTEGKRRGAPEVNGKYVHQYIIDGLRELEVEIRDTKPNIIIALGNTALWALTGETGIRDWRGSQLRTANGIRLVPTFHPSGVLRNWPWRALVMHDLRARVVPYIDEDWNEPDYEFTIRPSFTEVNGWLDRWEARGSDEPTAIDIETRLGHIACVGLGWDDTSSLCIPFMCTEDSTGYWSEAEETAIVKRLRHLLSVRPVIGQNFLYDEQYFARYWGIKCNVVMDTMLAQHLCYSGLQKGLGFLSSMYCDFHQYWKDEGKEWNPSMPEEQLWGYNCKDVVITWQVARELRKLIEHMGLEQQYDFQQKRLYPAAHNMMLRGTHINTKMRDESIMVAMELMGELQEYINTCAGHELNPRSSKQLQAFFYDDLKIKPVYNKTGGRSLDKEALDTIDKREPIIQPLTFAIRAYRSMGVFLSTFLRASLDDGNVIRCSFNVAGTETFRWSSSKNAFGGGTNLQNIPRTRQFIARDDIDDKSEDWQKWKKIVAYPAVRKLFIPSRGKLIADVDLDRADAQVVAWEADDDSLKQMFREGVDIHRENAVVLFGKDKLAANYDKYRQDAKQFVHLTNYGGSAVVAARTLGITVHDAERCQRIWFGEHPGILTWQERTMSELQETRTVRNKFGYHRTYFERVDDSMLKEALAWIPQSTVALVINMGLANLEENLGWVAPLLQVHDSLVFEFHPAFKHRRDEIRDQLLIPIPYDDPLTIPVGMKVSDESWGDCKEIAWADSDEWVKP